MKNLGLVWSILIALGAPAIAIVAALALAVELENADLSKFPHPVYIYNYLLFQINPPSMGR